MLRYLAFFFYALGLMLIYTVMHMNPDTADFKTIVILFQQSTFWQIVALIAVSIWIADYGVSMSNTHARCIDLKAGSSVTLPRATREHNRHSKA